MPNLRARRRLIMRRPPVVAAGPSFDAATLAWVAAVVGAGGTVSGTQQGYVDTLIKAYKAASVWTILDRVWLLASENTFQANIDIVNLATLTIVDAPLFSANVGYVVDSGSVGRINTNFTPSTAGGNYTRNSAHFGAYVKVGASAVDHAAMGVSDGGNFSYLEPSTSNTDFDVNGATFPGGTPAAAAGDYIASRTTSSAVALYRNGNTSPIGSSGADTSGALATIPFHLFFVNGFGHQFTTGGTLASAQIGGGVNSAQMASMASAMNAYQSSLGNNVY